MFLADRMRTGVRLGFLCLSLVMVGGASTAESPTATQVDIQFLDVEHDDATQRARLVFMDQRLRIEQYSSLRQKQLQVLIYRGDQDAIYSLSPADERFMVIDRALLTLLGTEMKSARREMEGALNRLPEDQRKTGERLIGLDAQQNDGTVQAALKVRDLGKKSELLGRSCREVLLTRGKRKMAEACIIPWSSVGIKPRDLDVFRQLANFQREIMGAGGLTPLEVVPDQPLDILVQFDGFPLEFRRKAKGELVSAIRVTSIKKVPATAKMFSVPRNYALRPGTEVFAEGVEIVVAPQESDTSGGAASSPGSEGPGSAPAAPR